MKFYFDKNRIVGEFDSYFSKRAEEFNLGPAEIPKIKEYTERFLNAIEKVQNDGYLKDGISEQKLTELLDRIGRLHQAISRLHNTLRNYSSNTRGTSRILKDEKGNIYQFGATEVVLVWLLSYISHSELIGNILKNIFDFKKINKSLPGQKPEYILEDGRITLHPMTSILEEYLGFDIFREFDLDLRNKISHWDFDLVNDGITYGGNKKTLNEILTLSKNANMFLVFISLVVGVIKDYLR